MLVNKKNYKTIWTNNKNDIFIIDQTRLPFDFIEYQLKSLKDAELAISSMQVRGAPLIGITAAFGIHLAMQESTSDNNLKHAIKSLKNTRPTAINLSWAVERVFAKLIKIEEKNRIIKSLEIAKEMALEDEIINKKIGLNGSSIIEELYRKKGNTINILTHCNAGWLATVDWGTATSPIYIAREKNIPIHVWVDETRPRNQGAYLTAWEFENESIDYSIITDNAGGHLMQNKFVDLVITGSDRMTFKGDVCNKIGTYLKAIAAKENKVPFYAALPSSTIDWKIDNVKDIIIEERNPNEVHFVRGKDKSGNIIDVRITPAKSKASNYSFDVTPSKYITGIITEHGVSQANELEIAKINQKNK